MYRIVVGIVDGKKQLSDLTDCRPALLLIQSSPVCSAAIYLDVPKNSRLHACK